jgi:hypothetical protein
MLRRSIIAPEHTNTIRRKLSLPGAPAMSVFQVPHWHQFSDVEELEEHPDESG